jgi:hypothetical protein
VEIWLRENFQLDCASRLMIVDTRNATRRIARHRNKIVLV